MALRVFAVNITDDRNVTKFWNSAWTLLILANLFWAGNIVLGRGLVGMVPPIALAYWRWTGAFLIAVGFAWPYLQAGCCRSCCATGA